jgi:hypothetical protein
MDRPSNPDKSFSIHPDTLTMKEKARQEGRASSHHWRVGRPPLPAAS